MSPPKETGPQSFVAVHLDTLLAQRGMTLTELADQVGITVVNLSVRAQAADCG